MFFESTKVKVEELEKKVEKLEKRLRKDEKMGVLDGKEERAKRQPSQYNLIIANETKKIKNGTRQDKFTEEVRRYHEMKEGKGKRHKQRKECTRNVKQRKMKKNTSGIIKLLPVSLYKMININQRSREWHHLFCVHF